MCGIAGLIGRESTNYADKAIKKLSHRGPDAFGKWQSGSNNYPVTLCHTRLNIIDNSNRGNQPLISSDTGFMVSEFVSYPV